MSSETISSSDLRDSSLVRTMTWHCRTFGENTYHAFTQADFESFVEDPKVDVIVGRGIRTNDPRFDRVRATEERMPVFAHRGKNLDELPLESLRSILTGEITNWNQLAAGAGPINLYLHGGELQKKAFDWMLGNITSQSEFSAEVSERIRRHASYESLAASAKSDTSALVMGLKELQYDELKPLRIDGCQPSLEQSINYPLRVGIGVFVRKSVFGGDRLNELLRALNQE